MSWPLIAYLDRIGYTGSLVPTLGLLTTLIERHMAAIPFEMIGVMLDRGADLTPGAVDRKMLAGQRAGYCFEHASLLRRVLRAIGFPIANTLPGYGFIAPSMRPRRRQRIHRPRPRPMVACG